MNKKILLVLTSCFALAACGGTSSSSGASSSSNPSSTSSSESAPTVQKTANIIMTAATIPPVVAALDSIKNGNETYAWIERGKTYSGIAQTEIENLGFDPATNLASGIPDDRFPLITDKVKELAAEGYHFNFYTTDYKPWACVKVASDAKLALDSFTINMVEDGTATYDYARDYFVEPYHSVAACDEAFEACVTAAKDMFDRAMVDSSVLDVRKNKIDHLYNSYVEGYYDTFALSTMPNFVHLVQNKTKLDASTSAMPGTLLRQAYGLDTNGSKYTANVEYISISERVSSLSADEKKEYLTLMFGDYREECERLLTRKKIDGGDDAVPDKKFIFIGTRMRQSDYGLVADQKFENLPANYEDISSELRQVFMKEADYRFVYDYLNDTSNYEATWAVASDKVLNAIKSAAFNHYVGYVYNLKFTYREIGNEYDILFKGHPSETFDEVTKWSYTVDVDGATYQFRNYMHDLAIKFHSDDSEGKFIGVLPGGVAAENLAYLGVDTYIGGLPSSTYTGYEKSAPILFVLNPTDGDILTDGNINQRYLDGELSWEEGEETIQTVFYNRGRIYSRLSEYFAGKATTATDQGEATAFAALAESYDAKFTSWFKDYAHVSDDSTAAVDDTGSPVLSDPNLVEARTYREERIDAIRSRFILIGYGEEKNTAMELARHEALAIVFSTDRVSIMDSAVDAFQNEVKALQEQDA